MARASFGANWWPCIITLVLALALASSLAWPAPAPWPGNHDEPEPSLQGLTRLNLKFGTSSSDLSPPASH